MDHFEMVEKLREKSGVSYEDAKAALEASNWDLLDAIVVLEGEGKITEGAKGFSTKKEEPRMENPRAEFKSAMSGITTQLGKAIKKGNEIMLDVHREGKVMFSMPMTVVVLLMIFAGYVVLPMMLIALFVGVTYKINGGKNAAVDVVNNVMDKASELANTIKTEVENNKTEGE